MNRRQLLAAAALLPAVRLGRLETCYQQIPQIILATGPADAYLAVCIIAPEARGWPMAKSGLARLLPFHAVLPCGESITVRRMSDIPWHDVPCPCGDPTHWLVKYEVKR